MSFIKSISGFRGTIGGRPGDNLTPVDIVACVSAFGQWLKAKSSTQKKPKIVIGRDGRISGPIVSQLTVNTLLAQGIDVVDLGLSTTPTVEIAVPMESASGGIILTASHNPKQWNALKLLNEKGEFISADDGKQILKMVADNDFEYADVTELGHYSEDDSYMQKHIESVLALELVNAPAIKKNQYKVVVDCINSTGSISVVPLLQELQCEVIAIHSEITGDFAHNPEPVAKHLTDLSENVIEHCADFGVAVDPDVDRLVFMDEKGKLFGEEYTIVAIADYLLSKKKGPTVSNLSSTRALSVVTQKHGCYYEASAVGEVNVVEKMKEIGAVFGGEGNGGVIYPASHYGRDALVGIALMMSFLSEQEMSMSALRKRYPAYVMVKDKIQLTSDIDVDHLLGQVEQRYLGEKVTTIDGVKIDFKEGWIHLRKSNTEPIIRLYIEGERAEIAENLAKKIKNDITFILDKELIN